MAAFLDGRLSPGELAEVTEHLRECEDCRTITGEAARFEQEEEASRVTAAATGTFGRTAWSAAAVAVIGAVVAGIRLLQPVAPMQALIDAAPRDHRRVDGRFSGFAWAPLTAGQRGTADSPTELDLKSAANKVLSRTIDDDAVESRRAAGVAHLLIDQPSASLEKLRSAAGDSKDAVVWNDLAAAQLTVAVREGKEQLLHSALASADRAIALDGQRPEAYFNRALILESLGVNEDAREAWTRYLQLDPSSEWSNEARDHLRRLGNASSDLDVGKELARAALRREKVAELVQRFPQESRRTGHRLLSVWAKATLAKDAARAEESLSRIRSIGAVLAETKGERFLADVVDAIDREDRRAVADVFTTYDAAGNALSQRNPDAAEPGFRRAATAFRALGNPLADEAEYFAGFCAYLRNNADASTAELHALRERIHPSYRALGAQIDWVLARNANSAADWGTAARIGARASATFSELGERANCAATSAIESFALDHMGALDAAWQKRVRSIAESPEPARAAAILHSAAVTLAAADQNASASSILDVAIANQHRVEKPSETLAILLTERARLAERAGDLSGARRWLDEARAAIGTIRDISMRQAPEVQIELADAVLRRASDPRGAIAALDESIAFLEKNDYAVRLPDAYLQRARAYRAVRNDEAALDDYDAALRAFDKQQKASSAEALRIEFLDVAAQAIDESIDLHLDRREIAPAFVIADRAHAMVAGGYRTAAVPEGTAVLEYKMLPDSLVVFCLTGTKIGAARVGISRTDLAVRVTSFVRKMQTREELTRDAQALYATLLAPAAPHIANASELVIVPDRELSLLPFAALHDGSRYLIESHALRIASSAAAQPASSKSGTAAYPATIIADPATARAQRLPWSRGEAQKIAAVIPGSTLIEGDAATRARVLEAIQSSDVIHYAGHADSDLESWGALLLASADHDSDLLTAAEIARLDLRARPLVVLSACGTLRGESTHVAGMPSLARAFLGAGARAVVGTLWEVDDDVASELFLTFHEHLRAGEVPAGALRAAQIAMLQTSDPRRRHPSSWSAVEVLSNF